MKQSNNSPHLERRKFIPASVIIFLREHRRQRLAKEAREAQEKEAHSQAANTAIGARSNGI